MANLSCNACEALRQEVPSLIVNGFDDDMCASLANDTGLVASSGNDDCEDLNNLNDCLIGNQEEEVELYDVCDWKTFMKQFIPNLWTTLKAMICAICGVWANIKSIWESLNKINCVMNYITKGASFSFGEYTDTGSSYIVAGKGVSFLNVSSSGTSADISLVYVAGGLMRVVGSCLFYDEDFIDGDSVYSFDTNGVDPVKSQSRIGNPNWVGQNQKPGGHGGVSELVYEIRIKRDEYPQLGTIYNGIGLNADGGAFHAMMSIATAGQYANGQHGHCSRTTGDPANSHSDRGHLVPEGWVYVQMRITWIESMTGGGQQCSPVALCGVRMNTEEIDC